MRGRFIIKDDRCPNLYENKLHNFTYLSIYSKLEEKCENNRRQDADLVSVCLCIVFELLLGNICVV